MITWIWLDTECPRSLKQFFMVNYYIGWVKTYCTYNIPNGLTRRNIDPNWSQIKRIRPNFNIRYILRNLIFRDLPTECPRSLDQIYIVAFLHEMGQDFLDRHYIRLPLVCEPWLKWRIPRHGRTPQSWTRGRWPAVLLHCLQPWYLS